MFAFRVYDRVELENLSVRRCNKYLCTTYTMIYDKGLCLDNGMTSRKGSTSHRFGNEVFQIRTAK
jgi:hypothetical protein